MKKMTESAAAAREIEPELIVMVDGGFCSQLVKYTLGEFLKRKLRARVKYDTSWFDRCGMDCDGKQKRELIIHKLFPSIDFQIATEEETRLAKKKSFCNRQPYRYCTQLLSLTDGMYVNGYYENVAYMIDVQNVLKGNIDFSHLPLDAANAQALAAIRREKRACAVHVRRGDYVNLGLAFLTPQYYVSALRKIQGLCDERVHYFFFSNDMDYVREQIIPRCGDISYTMVEANGNDTGYMDLFLISECWAQVSSNASFGFWGAFLNKHEDKALVLPSKWSLKDPAVIAGVGHGALAHYTRGAILLDRHGKELQTAPYCDMLEQAVRISYRQQKLAMWRHRWAALWRRWRG